MVSRQVLKKIFASGVAGVEKAEKHVCQGKKMIGFMFWALLKEARQTN